MSGARPYACPNERDSMSEGAAGERIDAMSH